MNKKIIYGLISLLMCLSFAGCIQVPEGDRVETDTKETVSPAEDYEIDAELLSEYEKYKTNASLAFTTYEPMPPEAFEYSEADGSVTLEKYIGEEKVVVVPENIGDAAVERIAAGCFAGLDVRAVYVPDSVTEIGLGAFEDCNSMTTVRLPIVGGGEGISNAGYIFGATAPDNNRIHVPPSLEMVIFGQLISEIPDEALSGFASLKAVILPDGVKSIGKFAFYECKDLLYVRLGAELEGIGNYAFAQCRSLINIELGEAVKSIGLGTFLGCDSLKYMTLPFVGGSVTENSFIGYIFGAEYAEWNGSFVPASLTHITLTESCTSIPDRAFSGCSGLIRVTLPDGLESIGRRSFYNCYSLREIVLPNTLRSISDDAFFYCSSLSKVTLGEASSLEEIGMQAFFGCEKLTIPTLPENVTVGENAFWGCKKTETET